MNRRMIGYIIGTDRSCDFAGSGFDSAVLSGKLSMGISFDSAVLCGIWLSFKRKETGKCDDFFV